MTLEIDPSTASSKDFGAVIGGVWIGPPSKVDHILACGGGSFNISGEESATFRKSFAYSASSQLKVG